MATDSSQNRSNSNASDQYADQMNNYYRDYYNQAQDAKKQMELALAGGYSASPDMARVIGQMNAGMGAAQRYMNTPEMQQMGDIYSNLAKGYGAEEIGGMRQQARQEIAGAAQASQKRMMASLGRQGVGGARAAAMQGQLSQQQDQARNQAETQMALQNAQMMREGQKQQAGFLGKKQAAQFGIAGGLTQAAEAGITAQKQAAANRSGGKK